MESKASFKARALETSGDDTKLKKAIEDLLGSEVNSVDMISFRQLWFESYTIAMTELEERVKKTPLDTPKALPLAERMVRIEKQKKDYPGLVFDQFLETGPCLDRQGSCHDRRWCPAIPSS